MGNAGDEGVSKRLDLDLFDVLSITPAVPEPGTLASTWPCPGCGERGSIEAAFVVRVASRTGTEFERDILICAACAEELGRRPSTG
jgi:hypothetical protein